MVPGTGKARTPTIGDRPAPVELVIVARLHVASGAAVVKPRNTVSTEVLAPKSMSILELPTAAARQTSRGDGVSRFAPPVPLLTVTEVMATGATMPTPRVMQPLPWAAARSGVSRRHPAPPPR